MFVIREDPFQGRKGQSEPQTIKAVVHAQYNSPMGLYSSQNIADTLGQTAEYALGDRDPRKVQPQLAPSYDSYQRQVASVQTQQQTSSYNYGTPQRVPAPAYQQHPSQQQHYPPNVDMNDTQPQSRVPTSYYQQQQPSYDRSAPTGYSQQQQLQSKSSFQRFEREHPQVAQSPKRVEFSPQATVLEEWRFPDQSQTVRTERQIHQQVIQQEREHVQRQQNEYRMAQQAYRQAVQNDQEYARTPQSPKSILRSEQQRPQSPRPVMRTEEEEEYQRRPVQERAAAFQEIIQTQDQGLSADQRTQHRGAPYERQVSTSTVQLKQVSAPSTERSEHPRPRSPRPVMRTDEDMRHRKAVQERAAAYKEMVQSHEQQQGAEQQRGPTYERQVSTSTVQLKSPTPDTRREPQQRPQYPPSPKVTSRVTTHASPSPSLSPAGTPNTTRKRMEAIWPPKISNVKQLPKTGFTTTSTGKQLVWPPTRSGWDSDGSWPPSGRQTPQSPPPSSRKMANAWNPSPSPPPMRRAVASPVTSRKAIWPPPSHSPEKSSYFQPINKPHRKHGKFEDYVHHHASCGVPATYRPPPSVQHVEVNY